MVYAPHILYKETASAPERDLCGRIVSVGGSERVRICRCRCDHSTDVELKDEDGHAFHPQWRVVCEGNRPDVKSGDRVAVLNSDGTALCSGTAYPTKKLNYLPYAEIYIKS